MVEYLNSSDVQAFLLYEDIDRQKKVELREKELAQTDPLTGALNRTVFSQRVDAAIQQEAGQQHALLMMDMDGFKLLNDSFGHAVGDQALTDTAAILRSLVRSDDLICRLGGDEFLVWLKDIPYDAVIEKIVRQICGQVRKTFSLEVQLSASVGIAVYPRDGHSFDELYRSADKAMYRVKKTGKDSYAFAGGDGSAEPEDVRLPVRQGAKPRRRMLIVDDSDVTRTVLAGLFEDEYLIEQARRGTDAMICLRRFGSAISIVLLDLSMPGMNGFDVLSRMQNNVQLKTIPVIVVSANSDYKTNLKAIKCGAADYVVKPVDPNLIRLRVHSAISRAENERLRAQNSYLQLQRGEELKYRTVLESTGTVVIEYNWHNQVFIYDSTISRYLAGTYNNRSLWQIFLSDAVAGSDDVEGLQDMIRALSGERNQVKADRLILLRTPSGDRHWFRVNVYKQTDDFGLPEKMIITFNDIHEEVLTNEKLLTQATRDELTGLFNRSAFIEKAAEMIAKEPPGYYVMSCIDVENFKVVNDQYGVEQGDELLRHLAASIRDTMQAIGGICCRYTADNFGMLYPAVQMDSPAITALQATAVTAGSNSRLIKIRIGRYLIDDLRLPAATMYDRATLAEESIRGRYDSNIAYYDSAMSEHLLHEQQIVTDMNEALSRGEFEPWFQPQYNHATGAMVGAEALVRWKKDGAFISPADFVPVFERNGFIYEMDQYIWEQVCLLLRRWLDEGKDPLPVSVNISRRDLFHSDFLDVLTGLVKQYAIPTPLLRLEVTESAFAESSGQVMAQVDQLIALGFTVEIDDFGSGYSSLNTLKDVPATILKLDMKFFQNTQNNQRSGNIVESVVRMAKWLGMAVIAEGVEDQEQADYLKSIGCYYIQGFFYARPMSADAYEELLSGSAREPKLTRMQTLETLDNNEFWNPKSMETLIFNSYVGGACIFEFSHGRLELLRMNDQYTQAFGGIIPVGAQLRDASMMQYLSDDGKKSLNDAVEQASATRRESFCELRVSRGTHTEYIRFTVRVIARTGELILCYGVVQNMTEQRSAEIREHNTSLQMHAILSNMHGGVTASIMEPDGRLRLLYANNRFYEMYGYTKSQYQQEIANVLDIVHPDDLAVAVSTVKDVLRRRGTASYEIRCIHRDGTLLWQQVNNSVITLEEYDSPVLLTVYNDITSLRLAQQEIAATSEKLHAVMNHAGNGITAAALRPDKTELLFANDKFFEIIGYCREDYEKMASGDMYALILPQDRDQLHRQIEDAAAGNGNMTFEYRIRQQNGQIIWVRSVITLTELQGVDAPVQITVFADITEEKESSEQLQFLNDTAHELLAQPDSAQAVDHTLRSLMAYFSGERAYVIEMDYAQRVSNNTYEICAPGVTSEIDQLQNIPFEVSQYWFDMLNRKEFVVIEDVTALDESRAELRRILLAQEIRSLIIAPLWRDGMLMGYVGVDNPARAVKQLSRLAALGDYIAVLLTRRDLRTKIDSDQEMMLSLMNHTPGGFVRMKPGPDGTFVPVFANDGFARLVGMDHEQLQAVYGKDVLAGVHPDDRDTLRRIGEKMITQGSTETARFRVRSSSGDDIWLSMYGRITKEASGDTYLNVYYTDVSDQLRAEQQHALQEEPGQQQE